MKKKPEKVTAIDSVRNRPEPPEGEPAGARPQKRFFSDPMTRRAFAGVFFGMSWDFWKACRETNCAPSAASEELRDHGYHSWQQSREAHRHQSVVRDQEKRAA